MGQESNIQNSRRGKRIYKCWQYTKSINQAENKNKEGELLQNTQVKAK